MQYCIELGHEWFNASESNFGVAESSTQFSSFVQDEMRLAARALSSKPRNTSVLVPSKSSTCSQFRWRAGARQSSPTPCPLGPGSVQLACPGQTEVLGHLSQALDRRLWSLGLKGFNICTVDVMYVLGLAKKNVAAHRKPVIHLYTSCEGTFYGPFITEN